jgi:hypothetical protein
VLPIKISIEMRKSAQLCRSRINNKFQKQINFFFQHIFKLAFGFVNMENVPGSYANLLKIEMNESFGLIEMEGGNFSFWMEVQEN